MASLCFLDLTSANWSQCRGPHNCFCTVDVPTTFIYLFFKLNYLKNNVFSTAIEKEHLIDSNQVFYIIK